LVERAPRSPAWAQLTGEEQDAIAAARRGLEDVLRGADAKAIRDATLALDRVTTRFAELMMEAAVSSAITGKTMDAANEDLGEEVTAPHPMAQAEFK